MYSRGRSRVLKPGIFIFLIFFSCFFFFFLLDFGNIFFPNNLVVLGICDFFALSAKYLSRVSGWYL